MKLNNHDIKDALELDDLNDDLYDKTLKINSFKKISSNIQKTQKTYSDTNEWGYVEKSKRKFK